MSRSVSIVMYHYVRQLGGSRYPNIKGRSIEDFRTQLRYIKANYTPVRMEDLIDAVRNPQRQLPDNAILLTFDDGLADHYQTVFPLLREEGVQGSFFPPARPILEQCVLDVHKIHFVLAAVSDPATLVGWILSSLNEARSEYDLPDGDELYRQYAQEGRWDDADVVFVKMMLQVILPPQLRAAVTGQLFEEFVSRDESAFSAELYTSLANLRDMRTHEMYVGGHGYEHVWLDSLSEAEQRREVDLTMQFLQRVGCDLESWVMCYPYGVWNNSLLNILRQQRCVLGLTTEIGVGDLEEGDPLRLARLDTNHLPPNAR